MRRAWANREYLFHRLAFGMAFYGLINGIFSMIGSWAIPREYDGYYHNVGTVGTCTAQGLFWTFSFFSGVFYYVSFSVYSYFGVFNRFEQKKYLWCEKWIHSIVHLISVGYVLYAFAIEGFNPVGLGLCKLGGYPPSCNFLEDIECERGDLGNPTHLFFIVSAPFLLSLLLPTFLMIALYHNGKNPEAIPREPAQLRPSFTLLPRDILWQSCVYLVVLYWAILPYIVVLGYSSFQKTTGIDMKYQLLRFGLDVNFALFFTFSSLAYGYFSTERGNSKMTIERPASGECTKNTQNSASEFLDDVDKAPGGIAADPDETSAPQIEQSDTKRYSFNIFDGTNSTSSQYAEFIFGGDSDDEEADNKETEHWSAIQDKI
eukprot:jgi/Psemu1/247379/estExt_Genewise1.C_10410013